MTPKEFRHIALDLPDASECEHMGHPDFRAHGKIFATLGYPDEHWGVVKLSPEEQKIFVRNNPAAFVPVKGGWGRNGSTQIQLDKIDQPTLRKAIVAAWERVVPKTANQKNQKPSQNLK